MAISLLMLNRMRFNVESAVLVLLALKNFVKHGSNIFQIKRDGNFSSMPDLYPKVVTRDIKTLFMFRIPKFSDMVIIDPVANTGSVSGGEAGDGDGDGDKDGASILPFNFLAFALLLIVATIFAM